MVRFKETGFLALLYRRFKFFLHPGDRPGVSSHCCSVRQCDSFGLYGAVMGKI
ncbi:hypothetical protein [Brasilonema sp. UFV-L1]|uniref:hypothetical protein n=1 Tax=Brasilonema sp. UFV-L1 TaxID=2234130 RepID=UPI00403F0767